jgi:hypothetical protein
VSNDARTATKPQLEIIQHIIQDLLSHYDSEEVERMWRLICQDREENVKKKKNQQTKRNRGK